MCAYHDNWALLSRFTLALGITPSNQDPLSFSAYPDAAGTMEWLVFARVAKGKAQPDFRLFQRIEATSLVPVAAERLVTAANLLATPANRPEPLFIDVRSQDLHRLGRIPGSLNLPLLTIKARGFLRPKRLVLLNEGHHAAELLEEARQLKELRFADVSVLEGGFRAWQQTGGPVEGEAITSAALATISPAQFHRARSDPGWLVLGAQTNPGPAVAGPLPVAATLPLDPPRFGLALAASIERQPDACQVLLLTAAGENYDAIEAALTGFRGPPVFYLAWGAAGYARFLELELAGKNRQQLSV